MNLGRVGIWSIDLRGPDGPALGAELEGLGYEALWVSGGLGEDVFNPVRSLLEATERVPVVIAVLPIYFHDPVAVSKAAMALLADHPDRLLLGLGVSHAPFVEASGERRWERPLGTMVDFLDALDAAGGPAREHLVIGALGPRMLRLAAERTSGAHPYLVTPDHTRRARELMGPDALLAPEQKVILETDPVVARARGRAALAGYLAIPNYSKNLHDLGFDEADFDDGGSDRLVDAIFPWGDEARIAQVIEAHVAAGADHVSLQVIPSQTGHPPVEEWRRLAGAVLS